LTSHILGGLEGVLSAGGVLVLLCYKLLMSRGIALRAVS
jgi:hypothetical protein